MRSRAPELSAEPITVARERSTDGQRRNHYNGPVRGRRVIRQETGQITVRTRGRSLSELTDEVRAWVRSTGIEEGLLTLLVRHTSASLLVQENASPEVQRDLEAFLGHLVPDGHPMFRHTLEGPDDMPAHIRSALTATTLSIPVIGGDLALGTWQGIYLYEHRTSSHRRHVATHIIGE
jgi:secondary thiamine-phosphate synthase enzyme